MTQNGKNFSDVVNSLGHAAGDALPVVLSPEIIGLLSDQLYRSPSKAIEELVVNGYDAEATEVRIHVPTSPTSNSFMAVYDDGIGMNYEGLADLWTVGRRKVRDETLFTRTQRRQIGKFGIGKLATYAVATRVTYVTKTKSTYLAVTINFRDFAPAGKAAPKPVSLDVRNISPDELWNHDVFSTAISLIDLSRPKLEKKAAWTVVLLEDLKEKALTLRLGRLRWVISTAMPLGTPFKVLLNKKNLESSKVAYKGIVEFTLADFPENRLSALTKRTGIVWRLQGDKISSASFPSGISGSVKVTKKTLIGKSSEISRSEGFFVYVRGRLVNEEDARFGLHELSHATLNRFRAEIYADDLDAILTANRESMEDVELYRRAQAVLNEVFNEARQRYEAWEEEEGRKDQNTREQERSWVPQRLVEYPLADALTMYTRNKEGTEPDGSWMYLDVNPDAQIRELATLLYQDDKRKRPYKYQYTAFGRSQRMVQFDPNSATFTINQDHELVIAYSDDPAAQRLLDDLVTAETMLEVYLREAGVNAVVIGEVLERRDLLFRGLANAKMFSLPALSEYVRDSYNSKTDLEIAVVAGARALGFVAKHVSGNGEPDGVARFTNFPRGEQVVVLEAKSSIDTPSAKDIDFAAIKVHVQKHQADGCILVAPNYRGDDSGNSARSARYNSISCWTVEQYASVIAKAESRQITARDILEIALCCFAPSEVESAVAKLLGEPSWEKRALYLAVVRILREVHELLKNSERTTMMVASRIVDKRGFENVEEKDVRDAVRDIAAASQGALRVRDGGVIVLNVDYDELERRIQSLTGAVGTARRKGAFGEGNSDN